MIKVITPSLYFSLLPQGVKNLVNVLSSQKQAEIETGWTELEIEISAKDNRFYVKVQNESVGFVFAENGDFVGMYNWK